MRQRQPREAPAIRIDRETGWAWRGEQRLELAPKAFAVLRHLVEHPEHLISKDDLLAAAWGGTVVSEASLTSCIRDLRKALDDSSRKPRYIETVHRRGFRFIGPIGPAIPSTARSRAEPVDVPAPGSTLVARDAEIERLHAIFAAAANGQRRVVFVTGEAGIGKTALVDAFLAQLGSDSGVRVGRGQCVEQYGATEPYLPILEALGRLGRASAGDALVRTLTQYAPTWLVQLPALLTDDELATVQRRAQGTTRERMLRELIEAFDALAAETTLVLVLEDLHWSDAATIDLLAMLARRSDRARLLILGTYRPGEVVGGAHPLDAVKRDLQVHRRCEEIVLDFLSDGAVGEYLERRFPGADFPADFAPALHRNTSGNPLFLVTVVDDLRAQGRVAEIDGRWVLTGSIDQVAAGVPDTLWQMVETQIDRLAPLEQTVLAMGSVAGADFSAALSTVDGIDARDGERCCAELARRGQFLRAAGDAEWPDGTVAGRYAFIHASYRNVLYARVPVGHRVGLHLRIGTRLETAYGDRAADIAGELAMHFEHGRDFARAFQYRRLAAEHALRQHAYREAVEHVTRAIDVVKTLPDSQGRHQLELVLQVMRGSALTALEGHASGEVEQAYARARELCGQVDDTPHLFPVFLGLGWFYILGGALDGARDVGARLERMAEATGDTAIALAAHNVSGVARFYGGEFDAALDHFERGRTLYDPATHSPLRSAAFRNVLDPGVSCIAHAGWTLWVLGHPDRAAARIREAGELAERVDHPFTTAHAFRFAAGYHLSRREGDAVRDCADASVAVATEHGFGAILKASTFLQGWAIAAHGRTRDGIARMREALAACREIRAESLLPAYLAWLAEFDGQPKERRALVREGLVSSGRSGCHYWSAELHRLAGTLALESGDVALAESSFREALTIASRQRARSFELRAATSLARLWRSRRRVDEARALLSGVYRQFTEGFETADLVEAKKVLKLVDA